MVADEVVVVLDAPRRRASPGEMAALLQEDMTVAPPKSRVADVEFK
ncbi:MAG: hypothetical protein JXO72_14800 [Vicinamibacteria bacterium]|nr:hypothetical protein [Vicinamibacteria bacterium]